MAVTQRRSVDVTLRDGTRLLIRPIVPEDKDGLREGFDLLSPKSRYRRFFTPMTQLTDGMLRELTEIDYVDRFALVAVVCEHERSLIVGVGRYVRLGPDDDPAAEPGKAAEIALAVLDPYQGWGIGTLLLNALVLEALRAGITRFVGSLLSENRAMHSVLSDAEARFDWDDGPSTLRFSMDLPSRAEELRTHPMAEAFRRLARGDAELYRAEPCPWVDA